MKTPASRLIACLAVAALLMAAGSAHPGERRIRLGVPPWQGAEVKSAVVAEPLEQLGWKVRATRAAAPLIFQELAAGRLDLNLSAWIPGQDGAFQPFVDDGRIEILGENLTGAVTGLAMPERGSPSGLRSLRDLQAAADGLGRRIHCIEPGSGANVTVERAVNRNLYGLGDWQIVASSTQAMLAQVKRAIRRSEPIVFCAWRPHWMNIAFELRYLDDPAGHWGMQPGSTRVLTLARRGLAADEPHVALLMQRFRVDASAQSRWVYEFARLGRDPEIIAKHWLANNEEQVDAWLAGVMTPDGRSGRERFAVFAAGQRTRQ